MPRFRYESIDPKGVPIHGSLDAADVTVLTELLRGRGQTLVSCSEVSLNALIDQNKSTLPRLYQLRLGEHLREALLTGLPAHEAVRAVAAEPLSHPMIGMIPWLQATATLAFLGSVGFWRLTGTYQLAVWATGIFAIVVVPILRIVVTTMYKTRHRQLLLRLANRLEAGDSLPDSLTMGMPNEVQCVMKSNMTDDQKARVSAELVPGLLGGNLLTQQFVLTIIGPLIVMAVVAVGLYTTLLFVVTKFGEIFNDFGTELPAMTSMLMSLASFVEGFGLTGWVLFIIAAMCAVVFSAVCLATGWGAETLEKIPVFGMMFRWSMQSKVARILSASIRNGCSYSEALRTATAGSGFASVKDHGELIASELDSRTGQALTARKLSGLPLSMLFVTDSGQTESERRSAISATFSNLSDMLQSATLGQGRLLAVITQFAVLCFTGFAIGFGVISMFLPLIRLLNDLS